MCRPRVVLRNKRRKWKLKGSFVCVAEIYFENGLAGWPAAAAACACVRVRLLRVRRRRTGRSSLLLLLPPPDGKVLSAVRGKMRANKNQTRRAKNRAAFLMSTRLLIYYQHK